MQFSEVVTGVLFGVWFLLSALMQWRPTWVSRAVPWDPLALLPVYRLFAPRPPAAEWVLRFRPARRGADGAWEAVHQFRRRRWFHFIWNPTHLSDCGVAVTCATVATSWPVGASSDHHAKLASVRMQTVARERARSLGWAGPVELSLRRRSVSADGAVIEVDLFRTLVTEKEEP